MAKMVYNSSLMVTKRTLPHMDFFYLQLFLNSVRIAKQLTS